MRLLVTADLHYNHPKSHAVADELIDRMNARGGDALLVIGDTATAEGDALERCLSRFRMTGPKLIVAGNHDLWTLGPDSYRVYTEDLPRRVRALGWHWLEGEPLRLGDVAVVGSVGWYDYSFAPPKLGVPRRFYEHKISPGAAARVEECAHLLEPGDDISPAGRSAVAKWNDGQFVKLGRSDEAFVDECIARLRTHLSAVADAREVIAAVHTLPFGALLPPQRNASWDFARAFLGSRRIGQAIAEFPNVSRVFCGHSHFAAEARIGSIEAVNIGSGYRSKEFKELNI